MKIRETSAEFNYEVYRLKVNSLRRRNYEIYEEWQKVEKQINAAKISLSISIGWVVYIILQIISQG